MRADDLRVKLQIILDEYDLVNNLSSNVVLSNVEAFVGTVVRSVYRACSTRFLPPYKEVTEGFDPTSSGSTSVSFTEDDRGVMAIQVYQEPNPLKELVERPLPKDILRLLEVSSPEWQTVVTNFIAIDDVSYVWQLTPSTRATKRAPKGFLSNTNSIVVSPPVSEFSLRYVRDISRSLTNMLMDLHPQLEDVVAYGTVMMYLESINDERAVIIGQRYATLLTEVQ